MPINARGRSTKQGRRPPFQHVEWSLPLKKSIKVTRDTSYPMPPRTHRSPTDRWQLTHQSTWFHLRQLWHIYLFIFTIGTELEQDGGFCLVLSLCFLTHTWSPSTSSCKNPQSGNHTNTTGVQATLHVPLNLKISFRISWLYSTKNRDKAGRQFSFLLVL